MSFTESESLVLRYLDIKPSKLKSTDVDYWINEQGLKLQHIEILDNIKNGDIKALTKMNNEGHYIEFYKDKMLKVAIENEQIDMIEYLSVSKQINKNINNYLHNVTPEFFEKLMERFSCYNNTETKYNSVPIIDIENLDKNNLYNYYRNLCVIIPEEVYECLQYYKKEYGISNKKYYKCNKELEHYLEKEYINEEEKNLLKEYGCDACLEQYYDGKNKCRNCNFDLNIFNKNN
jgi:hypothetical protein